MPRVRCAGHVMTCGACSCFNLGNSLPVALGPACARTDTTMTTEDRVVQLQLYVCTSLMLHIRHLLRHISWRRLAHATRYWETWHRPTRGVEWTAQPRSAIVRHQASVPQFASHDTRRHFGLWFWRPGPISSVEVCGFVKKPSSADQLRSQPRRVQLIRGCLGLEGIRRA